MESYCLWRALHVSLTSYPIYNCGFQKSCILDGEINCWIKITKCIKVNSFGVFYFDFSSYLSFGVLIIGLVVIFFSYSGIKLQKKNCYLLTFEYSIRNKINKIFP